jgi:hypothetical protein
VAEGAPVELVTRKGLLFEPNERVEIARLRWPEHRAAHPAIQG